MNKTEMICRLVERSPLPINCIRNRHIVDVLDLPEENEYGFIHDFVDTFYEDIVIVNAPRFVAVYYDESDDTITSRVYHVGSIEGHMQHLCDNIERNVKTDKLYVFNFIKLNEDRFRIRYANMESDFHTKIMAIRYD